MGTAADRLTQRAADERVPLYAMLELTWQCNLRCVHCFQEGQRDRHAELSTDEWKRLLDELADLGCVFLVLTGGEGLTRPDFAEIYRHAVARGFVVTVFTNGSLIDERLAALWSKLPPRKLELTLYGMSARTYREVTGHGEAFAQVMEAIERVLSLGIRIELKAPGIRPLVGDLEAMAGFARSRGLSFRSDPGIFPRLDGDRAPLAFRLSPAEVVELEAARPGFVEALGACFAEVPAHLRSRVYQCGAGSNSVGVDPSGHFQACPVSRRVSLDWRERGAAGAWRALAPEARRTLASGAAAPTRRPGTARACGDCTARAGCSRCPGKSWMETGDVETPVDHHCHITELRLRLLRESA